MSSPDATYRRYRDAIAQERLPCAIVDLEAFDKNLASMMGAAAEHGKLLRLASKSLRVPALLKRVLAKAEGRCIGIMGYAVAEAEFLVSQGFEDVLVAYPTVQRADLDALVALNQRDGVQVSQIVDDVAHVEALGRAAAQAKKPVPVVIDIDVALRPLGGAVHVGVQRSSVRSVEAAVSLAQRIARTPGLTFLGVMAYEAQVAGLTDNNPFTKNMNRPKQLIRKLSVPFVKQRRLDVVTALVEAGLPPRVVNGGGSGSLASTLLETAVTEVTIGSGLLCSHLFDYYTNAHFEPALYFAVQATRIPEPGIVTCAGGGFVASGEAGADRLPIPALPAGLEILPREGVGEVQTPLTGPGATTLHLGDPVFFRPAKTGELAEHFSQYLLVRGEQVTERVPTYRGLGHNFI